MRARSPKRILRFIAILAAALGGCQTAGTAPDSSRLAMGTRLSTGAISAVRTNTGSLSPRPPKGRHPESNSL